jgi:hypothetical protein
MNRPKYIAPDNNQAWFVSMYGALREAPCLFDGTAKARRRMFQNDKSHAFRDHVSSTRGRSTHHPDDRGMD